MEKTKKERLSELDRKELRNDRIMLVLLIASIIVLAPVAVVIIETVLEAIHAVADVISPIIGPYIEIPVMIAVWAFVAGMGYLMLAGAFGILHAIVTGLWKELKR